MDASRSERFHISLKTPAGELSTSVEVPLNLVPITAIVPLTRRLGEEATALEQAQAQDAGQRISCQKGCAACCRMLVPVSPPEAFALKALVESLPDERRQILLDKLSSARARLEETGLLARLTALAETGRPLSDEEMEPINRDYYALRMACPFLEQESCSIYEDRPAACRELLVTTPADLCHDLLNNPVQPLPAPLRVGTVLALLWSELKETTPTLIPLPMALEWAEKHAGEEHGRWRGAYLLERMLDNVWRMLEQEFANRTAGQAAPKP
ncbi:MAG TPA: YkgJ family cysteine cluster protein [Nitrospiraceae bacterium]|nr:YkgJ family cysteine cluster protein [Nitrospiraceae bacterium]